jgi:hypothetical protein
MRAMMRSRGARRRRRRRKRRMRGKGVRQARYRRHLTAATTRLQHY